MRKNKTKRPLTEITTARDSRIKNKPVVCIRLYYSAPSSETRLRRRRTVSEACLRGDVNAKLTTLFYHFVIIIIYYNIVSSYGRACTLCRNSLKKEKKNTNANRFVRVYIIISGTLIIIILYIVSRRRRRRRRETV